VTLDNRYMNVAIDFRVVLPSVIRALALVSSLAWCCEVAAATRRPACDSLAMEQKTVAGIDIAPGPARPLSDDVPLARFDELMPTLALYGTDARAYVWANDHYEEIARAPRDRPTHPRVVSYKFDKANRRLACSIELHAFGSRQPTERFDLYYDDAGRLRESRRFRLDQPAKQEELTARACVTYDRHGRADAANIAVGERAGGACTESVTPLANIGSRDFSIKLLRNSAHLVERIVTHSPAGTVVTTVFQDGSVGAVRAMPVPKESYQSSVQTSPVPELLKGRPLPFTGLSLFWPTQGVTLVVDEVAGNDWAIRRVKREVWRDLQRERPDTRTLALVGSSDQIYEEIVAQGKTASGGAANLSATQHRRVWDLLLGPSPRLVLLRGHQVFELVPLPTDALWTRCIDPKASVTECSIGSP
jgi:hypothetical protein